MNGYKLGAAAVMQQNAFRPDVLTVSEVAGWLERYGLSRLPEQEGIGRLKIFLYQFKSPLLCVLLIEAGIIAAILIINAVVGHPLEYKTETNVRALRNMICRVWNCHFENRFVRCVNGWGCGGRCIYQAGRRTG